MFNCSTSPLPVAVPHVDRVIVGELHAPATLEFQHTPTTVVYCFIDRPSKQAQRTDANCIGFFFLVGLVVAVYDKLRELDYFARGKGRTEPRAELRKNGPYLI
jgi:hypothetical protein